MMKDDSANQNLGAKDWELFCELRSPSEYPQLSKVGGSSLLVNIIFAIAQALV